MPKSSPFLTPKFRLSRALVLPNDFERLSILIIFWEEDTISHPIAVSKYRFGMIKRC
jgi:hypothetical protein